jgi:hypothetical protein
MTEFLGGCNVVFVIVHVCVSVIVQLLAALIWSTHGQPRPPSLIGSSSSVLLREGQNLTLECPVDSAGELRVQWFRNEQPATEKGTRFQHLTIDAVTRADAGAYRCSAENDVGALVSRTVNVTVSCGCFYSIARLHEFNIFDFRFGRLRCCAGCVLADIG